VLGCALLLTFAAGHAAPALAEPILPPGFQDTELELEGFIAGKGLEYPTAMRFAPNGELFVAQKTGEVLRYESVNDKTPTTFADLRTNVFDLGDRGILGLALDPKFEAGQPYVYVLYTYDHILGDPEPAPKWGEANRAGDECSKEEMGPTIAWSAAGSPASKTKAAKRAPKKSWSKVGASSSPRTRSATSSSAPKGLFTPAVVRAPTSSRPTTASSGRKPPTPVATRPPAKAEKRNRRRQWAAPCARRTPNCSAAS
jgi:hypothetical protein